MSNSTSEVANTPKPSANEVKQMLANVVGKPSRPRHIALLVASLIGAGVAGALLVTEPNLPPRAQYAFMALVAIGLSWTAFSLWTLNREGALLGKHRVIASRMGLAYSSLFTIAILAMGLAEDWTGKSRTSWYGALGTGVALVVFAAISLRRAENQFRELSSRRAELEAKLRSIAGALLLGVALLTPVSRDSHAQLNTAAASETPATFTVGGQPIQVTEGRFRVSANREAKSLSMLTLAYVRFKSTSSTPAAPIVFLAGGPGDAGTRALAGMPRALLDQLLSISDVIAFDQRGTGRSEPINPFCAPGELLPTDRAASTQSFLEALRPRVQACVAKATSDGIDVKGLNTQESADDVESLRQALGATRVMLLAGSYGTHLAIATAKRHPSSIDRMVLAGVEPLDATFKLPSRVDAVLEEIAKAKRSTLVADLRTLRTRLAAEPGRFTFPTGQTIVVGEWDVQRWASEQLDVVQEIDAMVAAIPLMLNGNFETLGRWALTYRVPKPVGLMNLATDCASYASANRLNQISTESKTAVLGSAINFPLPDLCEVPGLPRLPDAYRAPFTSNVNALLISGTLDGRTPPQNAIDAARSLPKAKQLVIEGASHSLFREQRVTEAMLEFFREGQSR